MYNMRVGYFWSDDRGAGTVCGLLWFMLMVGICDLAADLRRLPIADDAGRNGGFLGAGRGDRPAELIPDCVRAGLIARGMVDMSPNNGLVNEICVHG